MAEPVEAPIQLSAEDYRKLLDHIKNLEAENGRLRAMLNNGRYLAQRALALLSGGKLLVLAALVGAIAAIVLYVGTPLGGILESAWHQLTGTGQPAPHSRISPLTPFVIADPPNPSPSVSSLPSPRTTSIPIALKSEPAHAPSLSPPSPLRTCNGNHAPTDPICPPMGHKPSPSPPT